MAFELPIVHRSRHVPWGGASGNADIVRMGLDLTTASVAMNFALTKGGTPIAGLALVNAAAGTQGISLTYDAGYVYPGTSVVVGATIITPFIPEAAFEALTWSGSSDDPMTLYYDLLITPSGQPQQVFCFGAFTLYPGIGD